MLAGEAISNPGEVAAQRPDVPEAVELCRYYVLRRGFIAGPFSLPELLTFTVTKVFGRDDMVQVVGETGWLPLGDALDPGHGAETARAPQWSVMLSWAWLRLRYNLDEQSQRAGLALTALASVFAIGSRWPEIFWLPWLALAALAGVALLRHGRKVAAAVLFTVTVGAGIALWWIFKQIP